MRIGVDYKNDGINQVKCSCIFTEEEFGEIMMKAGTHDIVLTFIPQKSEFVTTSDMKPGSWQK